MKKTRFKLWIVLILTVILVSLIAVLLLEKNQNKPPKEVVKKPEPEEILPPEPKPEPSDPIQDYIDTMSVEEKVGQMFLVRCPEINTIESINQYKVGGYILFGRDFANENRTSITDKIQSYQNTSKIPLFIGVDEEGGIVNRVSYYPAFRAVPFHSPSSLYQEGGWDLIRSDTIEKSTLLSSLGINVNFAPVADVSLNSNDYMYPRSFGISASDCATYVSTVVEIMKQQNMIAVLKHFPGYGNNSDTHTGIAYDTRPLQTFYDQDFLPFQAGINSGASIVLVSHNIVESMDANYPASLSKKVHDILRQDLGFEGVIITDDLMMQAVKEYAPDEAVAVLAIQAGNDLLCCTDFQIQIPAVIQAVKNGTISEEQINASVYRILSLKQQYGIWQ